ncbi:hypothetical protein ABGT24_24635 [Peribacillus frigoritolerans]|uniref:hypothetical protein n=1 Tax=Peribacillus frigoritolerans TaxID=450367 RepID=UPI00345DDBF5
MYGQYLPYNYNYYGWQPQVLQNDNYFRETQGPIAGDSNDPNVAAFYGVTTGISADMDHNTRSMSLTLNRLTLENVDDAAGRWQIEGGQVFGGNIHIANYASTKRIVNQGTSPQNTAMLTLTLFFIGASGQPPQNITLQGSHDFNSGNQIGSVSAASSSFASYIGHQFRVSGNTLVIQ